MASLAVGHRCALRNFVHGVQNIAHICQHNSSTKHSSWVTLAVSELLHCIYESLTGHCGQGLTVLTHDPLTVSYAPGC